MWPCYILMLVPTLKINRRKVRGNRLRNVRELTLFHRNRRRMNYNGRSNGGRNGSGMRVSEESRCGTSRGLSHLVDGYISCRLVVGYNICSKVGGRQRGLGRE